MKTKINELKNVIIRFNIYEEIEEFQVLINRIKIMIGKMENLEVKNKNNNATQVIITTILVIKNKVFLKQIKCVLCVFINVL